MLQKLLIRNFALIDHIEIDFENGLTVITGETGAGKSILLGAMALILGKRADHSSLKNKEQKSIIEGTFNTTGYSLQGIFEAHNLDYDPHTILRREVTPQGKSRNFINDTPTTLDVMKLLGDRLIDIHSQQQSILLNDPVFQLQLIDSLANTTSQLADYQQVYGRYKSIRKEIESLNEQIALSRQKEDYIRFQLEELNAIKLEDGEFDELQAKVKRFSNAEELMGNYAELLRLLNQGDSNILDQFNESKRILDNTLRIDDGLTDLSERFDSLLIELSDLIRELESKADNFEYHGDEHQYLQDRLDEIQRLMQKHQLMQADELIPLKEKLESDLGMISTNEDSLSAKEAELKKLTTELKQKGTDLSALRLKVLPQISTKVESTLAKLGIPDAVLQIDHELKETFGKNGQDQFHFLFSANKGIAPTAIAKTASGGELSRLMLSLKELLAEKTQLPTVLFDEIDTGVSGEIADKMGSILKGMGSRRQVIAITHLPQLAAKGKSHFMVYKELIADKSHTQIRQLNEEERIAELAKMLSGETISEAAIDNAKELLIQ